MNIHPTAIIEPTREGSRVLQGRAVLRDRRRCGTGRRLPTRLARGHRRADEDRRRQRLLPFCAIGMAPQDVTYKGEPTRLEIGDHNEIREYVTINRGTVKGGGLTRIGSHILIMAYTHIAHDCVIGDHAILVNGATLGGHVTVEEWAVVGALCPVHQFVRIGAHSYIGGGTTITQDVLPFLHDLRRARHACLRNEQSRAGAPRILQRAHREDPSRLQDSAGVEAEHVAGAGEAEV